MFWMRLCFLIAFLCCLVVTAPSQKLGKMGSEIDQNWSVGHLGPDCGAMGGPGGPQGSFVDDFGVSLGCRWGALWRHFLYLLVVYFNAISNMFPEGLFDGSASLWGSFGHNF